MKLQTGLCVGIMASLAIGVSQWYSAIASIMPSRLLGTTIPMETEKAMPTLATSHGMGKVLLAGGFVKAEHPTMGGASVVMKDGKNFLMLDQQFKSDEGPDLYVLLHREAMPKLYGEGDYVSLGRLQQVNGAQVYAIPAGVKVEEFKSAVIWCKQFKATFGFAMLK
jgi:hypothetical protein